MGYHTSNEIPNYWTYANKFVLQDHLFEPALGWSLISHLYMVSGWSAACSTSNPMSCTGNIATTPFVNNFTAPSPCEPTGPELCLDRLDLPAGQEQRDGGPTTLRVERSPIAPPAP